MRASQKIPWGGGWGGGPRDNCVCQGDPTPIFGNFTMDI